MSLAKRKSSGLSKTELNSGLINSGGFTEIDLNSWCITTEPVSSPNNIELNNGLTKTHPNSGFTKVERTSMSHRTVVSGRLSKTILTSGFFKQN